MVSDLSALQILLVMCRGLSYVINLIHVHAHEESSLTGSNERHTMMSLDND